MMFNAPAPIRFAGRRVHDFNAQKQPCAADVLNPFVAYGQQRLLEIRADFSAVFLQRLIANNIEHGKTVCRGDGVSAKGVEVARAGAESLDNVRAHHKSGHGITVAHRLAHRSDVRNHPMALKSPHGVAGAGESRLDLVGYEKPASLADSRNGRL